MTINTFEHILAMMFHQNVLLSVVLCVFKSTVNSKLTFFVLPLLPFVS